MQGTAPQPAPVPLDSLHEPLIAVWITDLDVEDDESAHRNLLSAAKHCPLSAYLFKAPPDLLNVRHDHLERVDHEGKPRRQPGAVVLGVYEKGLRHKYGFRLTVTRK